MFMTLLVAQLKNQDPMEPQDGTAFVAQLAQFNSLDQLIGIRESMEQLVASINRPA
jgi:flagellar basal-body rod modification protein FlgD